MKITILGAGNAGCVSLLHFYYIQKFINQSLELELIYDKNIDPVPVGQGTNLTVSDIVNVCCAIIVISSLTAAPTPSTILVPLVAV